MNTADVLLSFVPPDILRSACAMLRCMGLYMKDRPDYYYRDIWGYIGKIGLLYRDICGYIGKHGAL